MREVFCKASDDFLALPGEAVPGRSAPSNIRLQPQPTMNLTVLTYSLYLALSVPLTVWVARTLHRNGRVFLIDCFQGNRELADSVNHLLVVGFYLVNIGFVSLHLKLTGSVEESRGVFEALSGKVGVVLLVLGAMHFFNLYVLTRMRRRGLLQQAPPPLPPDGFVTTGVGL